MINGRTWWLTTRNSQAYHVEMVELPVSILHAVKTELENSLATSYLAAVAMQELLRYQGRWCRAEISADKEEICF